MTLPLGIHRRIADDVPALQRGLVWCKQCGRVESVVSAGCLAHGWPVCHGETMTIDHPATWSHR